MSVSNLFADTHTDKVKHPLYVGVTGGYGWTTWDGLIPPPRKRNAAMSMSTPSLVTEGGVLWGLFVGYEFLPTFAMEMAYLRYQNARVTFDDESIFTFDHDGNASFTSKTETVSIMAKIMMIVPRTDVRIYSSLGLAEVHRSDDITDNWMGSPTFGVGVNYNFTEHVMGEIGAIYAAGRGQSELNPIDDYFPFMYGAFLRVAYRI